MAQPKLIWLIRCKITNLKGDESINNVYTYRLKKDAVAMAKSLNKRIMPLTTLKVKYYVEHLHHFETGD